MRDGFPHRRSTCVRSTRWHQAIGRLHDWRRNDRVDDLWALTHRTYGLDWSRPLLDALLEELHVSDDFDRLVGPVTHAPASQYPRLLVIALLVRHSWSPADLEGTATRLGLLSRNLRTAGVHAHHARVGATTQTTPPRTH